MTLCKKTHDEDQLNVLALGLNFATAPKSIPKKDIIARTEEEASRIKNDKGQQLREKEMHQQ